MDNEPEMENGEESMSESKENGIGLITLKPSLVTPKFPSDKDSPDKCDTP